MEIYMRYIRNYVSISVLLALVLTISLTACQKPSSNGPSSSSPPAPGSQSTPVEPSPGNPTLENGGGGIDGSGGNTAQSSLEEVQKAFDEIQKELYERFVQIAQHRAMDPEVVDFISERNAHQTLKDLFKNFDPSKESAFNNPFSKALKNGNVRIIPQETDCQTRDSSHDGSATGNLEKGEICISLSRLTKLPARVLHEEIFLLLVHEMSHLAGFNEQNAEYFQRFFLRHPKLYQSQIEATKVFPSFKSCDGSLIQKEQEEMDASPYWRAQKAAFIKMLSGSQPRNCGEGTNQLEDKVVIFADDAEWLGITAQFAQTGMNWQKKNESGDTFYTVNWIQNMTLVASIYLETETMTLSGINGKIGTPSQCSTKSLLANLLANTEAVLSKGCNTHDEPEELQAKRRIQRQKEILDGEKSAASTARGEQTSLGKNLH